MSSKYVVGIACVDKHVMNTPFLMKSQPIVANSFEQAAKEFLSDPSVKSSKSNNLVMLLRVGT